MSRSADAEASWRLVTNCLTSCSLLQFDLIMLQLIFLFLILYLEIQEHESVCVSLVQVGVLP